MDVYLKVKVDMNDFVASKLEGLKLDQCWDVHAHLLGTGDSDSGIYMKPAEGMSKSKQVIRSQLFKYFTRSIKSPTDHSYLDFFSKCADATFPGFKSFAFAFTAYHDSDGRPQPDLSDFIIPNNWSKYAADKYSNLLYVASVHPKAEDAIAQLELAKLHGAVAVKWLPCAHNINPSNKYFIPFYEKLRDLKLPLITHAGSEHAVQGSQFDQSLGNPLHLRLPLEHGVKVIIAHCATDGTDFDFEESHTQVPSYNLFSRLMETKAYDGYIYADISATPQINRSKWLPYLLQRQEWHHKLLNGSDYPLPAIPVLFSLRWLRTVGLLSESDLWELNHIRRTNPLLFDFLLKRSLSYNGHTFSNAVFETRRVFDYSVKL